MFGNLEVHIVERKHGGVRGLSCHGHRKAEPFYSREVRHVFCFCLEQQQQQQSDLASQRIRPPILYVRPPAASSVSSSPVYTSENLTNPSFCFIDDGLRAVLPSPPPSTRARLRHVNSCCSFQVPVGGRLVGRPPVQQQCINISTVVIARYLFICYCSSFFVIAHIQRAKRMIPGTLSCLYDVHHQK